MITLDFALTQGTFVLDEAIAGLRAPARGTIALNDRVVFDATPRVNVPPHQRHVGDVAQDVSFFPHLDRVRDELAVPIVYVAHDRGEAARFAGRIVVLEGGAVVRSGMPSEVLW